MIRNAALKAAVSSPDGFEFADVVLFDLTWNPASIEQRIGRVHRIGGSRKPGQKVVVSYCFQDNTYEAAMAQRVQQRCEMMRAVLGAGQWLDADHEVRDLER